MTDTSMIEKVARAIYEGRNGTGAKAWGALPNSHRDPYRADARAAIAAMREPSERMVYVGEGYADFVLPLGHDNSGDGRRKEMRMAFTAMIDAALKD